MVDLSPEIRKRIYAVVAALVPLLVIVGAITDDVAQHVLTFVAAVLAVGGSSLAFANVTTPSKTKAKAPAASSKKKTATTEK
jgi:hypothetical protein